MRRDLLRKYAACGGANPAQETDKEEIVLKLSFSIQNWKEFGWEEFCDVAVNTRMQGIEIYDIEGPVFEGKGSITNPDKAAGTRRELTGKGLQLPCICTVNDFKDPQFSREFDECLEVAVNLGVSYIGIHTDSHR